MSANPTIGIPSSNDVEDRIRFRASANFLCNFMKKPGYLIECLRDMALKPRYVEERIGYLNLDTFSELAFPMTCFCDIPLSKAEKHMELYGHYGIALNKSRCMRRNVQPVMYLNEKSALASDFKETFEALTKTSERVDDQWQFLPDMLLSLLLYTKPVRGSMWRDDGDRDNTLFIDECEWRYIPEVPKEMPLSLPTKDNTEEGRREYSKALATYEATWFTFDVDKIDHIIVPDERGATSLIGDISSMKNRDEEIRYRLMSKIETADKFELNFV